MTQGSHRTANRSQRYRDVVEFDAADESVAIGVVVPFDFNLDWEYWRYLPPNVGLHFTRTAHLRSGVGVRLARNLGRPSTIAKATRALGSVNPAAVLYACSSGSFVDGVAGEQAIRTAMLEAGAPAAVTTAGATVDALTLTGMQRVAVVTPYTAVLTLRLVRFLEEAGFDVVSADHLGLKSDISRVSKETVARLVRQADEVDADAVVVSCTALRTWGIVRDLEGELGRPVFTSNQVSLWAVLVAAGVLGGELGQPGSDWTMGGENPARSTRMLINAAQLVAANTAA
jgi:maleate isomerase